MSLTQDQIQQIETYLNFKELTHLDLRNEVLDHMAIGIETSLQENKGNFKDALNKEVKKWNIELSNYSSFWLGWSWAGPKILIRKCVGKAKLFYLRTIVATAALMIILHLVYKVFNVVKFMDELNIVLGLGYLVFLGLILFFHLKINLIIIAYNNNNTNKVNELIYLRKRHTSHLVVLDYRVSDKNFHRSHLSSIDSRP